MFNVGSQQMKAGGWSGACSLLSERDSERTQLFTVTKSVINTIYSSYITEGHTNINF